MLPAAVLEKLFAVIGREHDPRALELAAFAKLTDKRAQAPIQLTHRGSVLGLPRPQLILFVGVGERRGLKVARPARVALQQRSVGAQRRAVA